MTLRRLLLRRGGPSAAFAAVAVLAGAAAARGGREECPADPPAPRTAREARAPKPPATPNAPAKPNASRGAPEGPRARANADTAPFAIAFPLDGPARILDTFGEARGGGKRKHEGVDMMSPRRTPVLAAADGVVSWAHDQVGGRCCDLEIRHDAGWRTRYIHLDNDTPGTDDGQGYGIAEGVVEGAHVVRGQVIGWVGDSGNAEACDPHLHFELRGPDGKPVDPRPLLLLLQALPSGTVLAWIPPPVQAPTG